jgi:hypothetical protein
MSKTEMDEALDAALRALSVVEMTEFDLRLREVIGLLARRIETVAGAVAQITALLPDITYDRDDKLLAARSRWKSRALQEAAAFERIAGTDEGVPAPPTADDADANGVIPRRINQSRFTRAEIAITHAIAVVDMVGCDTRLTNAVILLQQARDAVADFVDGVDKPDPNGTK